MSSSADQTVSRGFFSRSDLSLTYSRSSAPAAVEPHHRFLAMSFALDRYCVSFPSPFWGSISSHTPVNGNVFVGIEVELCLDSSQGGQQNRTRQILLIPTHDEGDANSVPGRMK